MTIPVAVLAQVKDLALVANSDQTFDSRLQTIWHEEATSLAREHEVVAEELTLTAVANQSLYSLPDDTTRILSVSFNSVTLSYTDSATLGLSNPDWATSVAGTPRLWAANALSPSVDSPAPTIGARDFLILPPPAANLITATSLKVVVVSVTDEPPVWVLPYLSYRTVSRFVTENVELQQPQKGQWFSKLSTLFEKLLTARVQI